jgi:hypothetical protein
MNEYALPELEPSEVLSAMDSSVAIINEVIDGTSLVRPIEHWAELVVRNVSHLETMTTDRVGKLGESPDLSSYETAITAGRAYLESA